MRIRAIVTGTLLALAGVLLVVPAEARPPDAHGWWWFAQPAGPLDVPAPPYVPEDGLYVASNLSGAEAVSAIRVRLAEGEQASALILTVADEPRGEPVIGACLATEPWEPAQGGALAEAPPFDCDAGASVGVLSEDGSTVTFPLAALVRAGAVDVVLVPGQDAEGRATTFQVAFEPPGPEAVATAATTPSASPQGSEPAAPPPPPPPPPPATSGFESPAPQDFAPVSAAPSDFSVDPPAPVEAAPLEPELAAPALPTQAPRRTTPISSESSGNRTRTLGFVVLAAAGLAYHKLSTTSERTPRSLVQFGQRGDAPETVAS